MNPFTRTAAGRMTWSGVIATDAHIHNAPAGTPGAIVVRGTVVTGDKGSLVINTPGALADNVFISFMQNGLYYNVHSATFPSGEIRGQLAFTP